MQMIYKQISEIVSAHVNSIPENKQCAILDSLALLLGKRASNYDFTQVKFTKSNAELQNALYNINEKTETRKNKGVYYTPEDVSKYIICNSMLMMLDSDKKSIYKEEDVISAISQYPSDMIEMLISKKTFFDPTCGSGEFLLNVFKTKYAVLRENIKNCTDSEIYNLSKTIYGNDIDSVSTDINKIRLFFEICQHIESVKYYRLIATALNSQFSNIDYVVYDGQFNNSFDCIVGNPPYVEYGKFDHKDRLQNNYGNIYADVIKNSVMSLKQGGTIGFIIPLSYISTSRMFGIRNYICENTDTQCILSFADRPDCLFQGVHQKLNIIIAQKGKGEHRLYTSNYKHWYKEERKTLFNRCEIKENCHATCTFIPKIGNAIEDSIYRKILTDTNANIIDSQSKTGKPIYLNMRGCFWIKAFSFNPGSNEYKAFTFDNNFSFVHCVLNSSLFWIYWTIMSDCWHITAKELKGFYIPVLTEEQYMLFDCLSEQLEKRLEQTKKYIGSKQVDYEYKHKECKTEIDKIDDLLADIYKLTEEELAYIKNFALKYRMGSGTDDKDN